MKLTDSQRRNYARFTKTMIGMRATRERSQKQVRLNQPDILHLIARGTCDSLHSGLNSFLVTRKQERCPCCGGTIGKLRIMESKRETVRRRIRILRRKVFGAA